MEKCQVTEDAIFECFAAAEGGSGLDQTAESFVDVEEYENGVMYPSFAKWAETAGYPEIARLFMKVAGEEKLHSKWLRELYREIGTPKEGADTMRAKDALKAINANMERLVATNPDGMIEKALSVALRVENREWSKIYPAFRDQALADGNRAAAEVYQRVIDSEKQHAGWFEQALADFKSRKSSAVAATA
jgi:rubrerythrin